MNPRSLLTASLQNYSREYLLPIDELVFSFKVGNKNVDHRSGTCIHGLYLDGARWEEVLTDPLPFELFSELPAVHLLPTQGNNKSEISHYSCPVYRTADRREVVFSIDLPTKDPEKKWILRSACALCEVDQC